MNSVLTLTRLYIESREIRAFIVAKGREDGRLDFQTKLTLPPSLPSPRPPIQPSNSSSPLRPQDQVYRSLIFLTWASKDSPISSGRTVRSFAASFSPSSPLPPFPLKAIPDRLPELARTHKLPLVYLAPQAITELSPKSLAGKRIAIDASMR